MAVLSLKICLSTFFVLCMINVAECGKGGKGKIQKRVTELEKTQAELRDQCCGKLNPHYIKCLVNGGVFGDSCYMHFPETTWQNAVDACSAMGAHLAEVHNEAENEFLENLINKHGDTYVWLGASDTEEEGVWRWQTTNEKATFTVWNRGEPNGARGENCLMMNKDPHWNDLHCDRQIPYVCEFSH